jgi:hypothetical protein
LEILEKSIVQKEDLEIKEHLVNHIPTLTPYWTRQLRWDMTGLLGTKTQKTMREGNSKSFFTCKHKQKEPSYPS